uniref:ATP synthase complex subunit 8 n=1 Tax=Necturus beyeri TaxID=324346 RepID=C9DHF1_9SALA|nr:ATP synthase F0 subunit 8 [Necturus beyeri]ACU00356.1 ATP synthase F0 subunit 8 [Necturus beyeri]
MPQLNPSPWLFILLVSWLVYLLIIMPKISKMTLPNDPTIMEVIKDKPQPWNWPWT